MGVYIIHSGGQKAIASKGGSGWADQQGNPTSRPSSFNGTETASTDDSSLMRQSDGEETAPPHLTMELNGEGITQLVHSDGTVSDVFSGAGEHVNNPLSTDQSDKGPLPMGEYYIVGRSSGGFFGKIKSWITGRNEWFALYRRDGVIDDFTRVNGVERSLFRMHPGRRSAGCVTFCRYDQFTRTRNLLLNSPNSVIPNTNTTFYGTLTVK